MKSIKKGLTAAKLYSLDRICPHLNEPMPRIFYISHPEVVIDPDVPIPDWQLSPLGRVRMARFAQGPELKNATSVWSSAERKAKDGALILGAALKLDPQTRADLGEHDRSATGYVAPPRFWEMVEAFFANPDETIEGWETARAAQTRIVSAIREIAGTARPGDIAIIAHGGVGALLRAHLAGAEINRSFDQPAQGHWFSFDRDTWLTDDGWNALPDAGQTELPRFKFGDTRALCEWLTGLALAGKKTGTCWPLHFLARGEPMLKPGDQAIYTDLDGKDICRTELTRIQVHPFNEVSEEFALSEGEPSICAVPGTGGYTVQRELRAPMDPALTSRECSRRRSRRPAPPA